MVTRNIPSLGIVNGQRGEVVGFLSNPDRVTIKVNDTTVTLGREVFGRYDPSSETCIAKRSQIPLKLAYATTGTYN